MLLTRSAAYFSDIDSSSIRDYVLTRARVEVSDGEQSEILTLKPNDAYFPPYVYVGTKIKGLPGKTYKLNVKYNGREVNAETSIPEPVLLDSTWFLLDKGKDSLGFVWIKFKDNPDSQNYYRTSTKIKSKDNKYIATFFPNFKDEYFNGQQVEFALYKGNKSSLNKQNDIYYKIGDTISLKFATVNKVAYDFWSTFQKEIVNAGNPFAATNSRVKSNINNGLGIWCGYGSTYYQIIAKDKRPE